MARVLLWEVTCTNNLFFWKKVMSNGIDFSDEAMLRMRGVQQVTGLGRSTLYELQHKDGPRYDPSFPVAVPLGPRARGYFKSEVLAWLAEKAKQRKKGGRP